MVFGLYRGHCFDGEVVSFNSEIDFLEVLALSFSFQECFVYSHTPIYTQRPRVKQQTSFIVYIYVCVYMHWTKSCSEEWFYYVSKCAKCYHFYKPFINCWLTVWELKHLWMPWIGQNISSHFHNSFFTFHVGFLLLFFFFKIKTARTIRAVE